MSSATNRNTLPKFANASAVAVTPAVIPALNAAVPPEWWQWSLDLNSDSALTDTFIDPFTDALLLAGALSVQIEDADQNSPDEQAIYGEPGLVAPTHWRRNVIKVLLSAADFDPTSGAAFLIRIAAQQGLSLSFLAPPEPIYAQDWVRQTQSQFPPIEVNSRVRIVPSWHQTTPALATCQTATIELTLDPGLAFGTGSHPTTFLCLCYIDAHLKVGESVLDYGCGSGILALLAAKRGGLPVFATDIDPQALRTTIDNANINGCDVIVLAPDALDLVLRQRLPHSPLAKCDWVIANILTNPLIALAPILARYRAEQGRMLLSGILVSQAAEVIAAYAPFVALKIADAKDGWVILVNDLV